MSGYCIIFLLISRLVHYVMSTSQLIGRQGKIKHLVLLLIVILALSRLHVSYLIRWNCSRDGFIANQATPIKQVQAAVTTILLLRLEVQTTPLQFALFMPAIHRKSTRLRLDRLAKMLRGVSRAEEITVVVTETVIVGDQDLTVVSVEDLEKIFCQRFLTCHQITATVIWKSCLGMIRGRMTAVVVEVIVPTKFEDTTINLETVGVVITTIQIRIKYSYKR